MPYLFFIKHCKWNSHVSPPLVKLSVPFAIRQWADSSCVRNSQAEAKHKSPGTGVIHSNNLNGKSDQTRNVSSVTMAQVTCQGQTRNRDMQFPPVLAGSQYPLGTTNSRSGRLLSPLAIVCFQIITGSSLQVDLVSDLGLEASPCLLFCCRGSGLSKSSESTGRGSGLQASQLAGRQAGKLAGRKDH